MGSKVTVIQKKCWTGTNQGITWHEWCVHSLKSWSGGQTYIAYLAKFATLFSAFANKYCFPVLPIEFIHILFSGSGKGEPWCSFGWFHSRWGTLDRNKDNMSTRWMWGMRSVRQNEKSRHPSGICKCCELSTSISIWFQQLYRINIKLSLKCMNSYNYKCLCPLLCCNGWNISTVEALGSKKNGLHPIQQRLVHFSGTQCGFCTSGMVMSMHRYALN